MAGFRALLVGVPSPLFAPLIAEHLVVHARLVQFAVSLCGFGRRRRRNEGRKAAFPSDFMASPLILHRIETAREREGQRNFKRMIG